MNILLIEMSYHPLQSLLVIALSATQSFAQGVKGDYHASPSESFVSFPAKESGTCYKRLMYSQVQAANFSGNVQLVSGTETSPGTKTGGVRYVTVIDCCDGFFYNKDLDECETYCHEGCFGGVCSGPNICICDRGYTAIGGICKPVCSKPCPLNSICSSPEDCKCDKGYNKVAGECQPYCPGGCPNGVCVAPEACVCKSGFILNEVYKECVPVCGPGCVHGQCTAPGFCRCYPGYGNPMEDTETCEPLCPEGCYGGECILPGKCQCREGSFLDSTNACIPSPGIRHDQGSRIVGQQIGIRENIGGALKKLDPYNQQHATFDRQAINLGQQSDNYDQQHRIYEQSRNFDKPLVMYHQESGIPHHQPGIQDRYPKNHTQQPRIHSNQYDGEDQQIENHDHLLRNTDQSFAIHSQQYENYDQKQNVYNQHSGLYNQQQRQIYNQQLGRYIQNSRSSNRKSNSYYNEDSDVVQQKTSEIDSIQVGNCGKQCINGQCSRNECICNNGYILDRADISGIKCVPA